MALATINCSDRLIHITDSGVIEIEKVKDEWDDNPFPENQDDIVIPLDRQLAPVLDINLVNNVRTFRGLPLLPPDTLPEIVAEEFEKIANEPTLPLIPPESL